MTSSKTRKNTMNKQLRTNIIKSMLKKEKFEVDENMLDYKVNLENNPEGSFCAEIKKNVQEIMDATSANENVVVATISDNIFPQNDLNSPICAVHNKLTNYYVEFNQENDSITADSDSKYIILEKIDNEAVIGIKKSEKGGLNFYNPMQSREFFEKNYQNSLSRLKKNPKTHLKGNSLAMTRPYETFRREVVTNKFPGALHLALASINGYCNISKEHNGISLKIEVNGVVSSTSIYLEQKDILLNHYLKIPIEDSKPIKIKILLQQHKKASMFFNSTNLLISQCILKIENIDPFQNKLVEMVGHWTSYRCNNVFKNIKRALFGHDSLNGTIRAFASYLSNDEVPTIHSLPPNDFYSLNKWLITRKCAYDLLFAGYVDISYAEEKWRRMYAKWYGYSIHLFDETFKRLQTTLNIIDSEILSNYSLQNVIGFKIDEKVVKIRCDTPEKLNGCLEALSLLFPGVQS